MPDEIPPRLGRKTDTGDAKKERSGEQSALQTRATFLKNWDWELVTSLNQIACARGKAQHGNNTETHGQVRQEWEDKRENEITFKALLDFLRYCHRQSPFLFFNGNTFSDIARRSTDALLAEFPQPRKKEASSLAAHYVAGVLEEQFLVLGLESLTESFDFETGDRVKTLKGAMHGVIQKVLPDGRVSWLPDGSSMELLALPESLLREKNNRQLNSSSASIDTNRRKSRCRRVGKCFSGGP